MTNSSSWTVLLIGGASGSGKSSVAYPLAALLGVPVLEVDDLELAIRTMTNAETQPNLHHWQQRPDEVATWGVERIVQHQQLIAATLSPAILAVIENHLETNMPVIIEGDYLLPKLLATVDDDRVRGVWIYEPSVEQIVSNFRLREPASGSQHMRAEVSGQYGHWLAGEAASLGLTVIEARPWKGVVQRVLGVLALQPPSLLRSENTDVDIRSTR